MRQLKRQFPLICLIGLGTLGILVRYSGLYINLTPSMPKGLYITRAGAITRGDTVAVCLTSANQQLGLAHRYLEHGAVCNGSVPLIKTVLAVSGDQVRLTEDAITVNGIYYPYVTRAYDSNHQPLKKISRGTYVSHGYWLIGSNSPNSWDSRYWGEVKRSQIRAKLRAIITWCS